MSEDATISPPTAESESDPERNAEVVWTEFGPVVVYKE